MSRKNVKPFSAGYYIAQNRLKCGLLIFMFFLTYIAYLGGLYVTNIPTMYEFAAQRMEKYAVISPSSKDADWSQFEGAVRKLQEEDRITMLQQSVFSYIYTKSIMSFELSYPRHAFRTVEDFKTFCDYMGITCDFENLKEGSFIASKLMANGRNMKIGDALIQRKDENVYQDYTLDAITDEEGYTTYFINDNVNYNYILLPTGMTLEEFHEYMNELEEEFEISVSDVESYREETVRDFGSFQVIYAFIVVLLAVVMAITINAAFVGMYQHRESEFAVYRAIGISKGRIIGKIIKELLLMDAMGIVFGGVVMLLAIYLLNELALIPQGWMLLYYHPTALWGMLLCNITVLVPLVLSRSRKLLKADICAY
ncbi:MAG: ABC transporter permease [Lachnospiraceae bacterium]|nr:ABC transporter permease [Lachnospiraceae bacterium]